MAWHNYRHWTPSRHPDVIGFAAIVLADRIVRRVWHTGYPHATPCAAPGCVFKAYRTFRMNNYHIKTIITWRRIELFGPTSYGTGQWNQPWQEINRIMDGGELWDHDDPEIVLGHLRAFATRTGIPHHDVVDVARDYARTVLAAITLPE